jgi:hypothetical protein
MGKTVGFDNGMILSDFAPLLEHALLPETTFVSAIQS